MGTRAITEIKPLNMWVITQFDGDNIGENVEKAIRNGNAGNILEVIEEHHTIRAQGKTEKAVRKMYGVTSEKDYHLFMEWKWIIQKNWKIREDKTFRKKSRKVLKNLYG